MNLELSVSEQLRRRRIELGLPMSEIARRAGTSVATLSRYEHGWSRFETYTLQKLSSALDCELLITLHPKKSCLPKNITPRQACKHLQRLFWDHQLTEPDMTRHPVWVTERVLEFGNLDDIRMLQAVLGKKRFRETVQRAGRLSPKTRNFWDLILKQEGITCTKKRSRNTAWIS